MSRRERIQQRIRQLRAKAAAARGADDDRSQRERAKAIAKQRAQQAAAQAKRRARETAAEGAERIQEARERGPDSPNGDEDLAQRAERAGQARAPINATLDVTGNPRQMEAMAGGGLSVTGAPTEREADDAPAPVGLGMGGAEIGLGEEFVLGGMGMEADGGEADALLGGDLAIDVGVGGDGADGDGGEFDDPFGLTGGDDS